MGSTLRFTRRGRAVYCDLILNFCKVFRVIRSPSPRLELFPISASLISTFNLRVLMGLTVGGESLVSDRDSPNGKQSSRVPDCNWT